MSFNMLSEDNNDHLVQVRTLLNDYITDEEQGVVSGRNPISSINEVLRDVQEGKYNRDKLKVGLYT